MADDSSRRCPSVATPIATYELIPEPHVLVAQNGVPDTIARWQALADSLLTDQACAFHRNVEISSRYAWIYKALPRCLKWAGMAAIASHHVRLALFPLRLDADRTGYVDIPHSLGRRRLLLADVDTIRATNNAIFNDIFWVHLAYVTAEDGIQRLRTLLHGQPEYAPVLAGFETIDRGRRVLEDVRRRHRSGDMPMTSSGSATSSSLSTSSAPSCSPISITSRVHSRVWSRLAPQRTSRCVGVGASWRTSRRSTSTRSPEECRTSFARARGRESLATTTAGAGSRQALCPTSAGSTQTCAVSTPACCASSTTHAATQRPRAYYQQSRHKARLTPSGSALSTDTGMRPPCPQCRR